MFEEKTAVHISRLHWITDESCHNLNLGGFVIVQGCQMRSSDAWISIPKH
jgi:hypothetical protein